MHVPYMPGSQDTLRQFSRMMLCIRGESVVCAHILYISLNKKKIKSALIDYVYT